jgi:hypothetical protein
LKKIDQLRTGPAWKYSVITAEGDEVDEDGNCLTEEMELWYRDPVECCAELISNPAFDGHIAYAPEKVYADSAGETRQYDEMWTGDWWWEVQGHIKCGGAVCPIILSSDKTSLT